MVAGCRAGSRGDPLDREVVRACSPGLHRYSTAVRSEISSGPVLRAAGRRRGARGPRAVSVDAAPRHRRRSPGYSSVSKRGPSVSGSVVRLAGRSPEAVRDRRRSPRHRPAPRGSPCGEARASRRRRGADRNLARGGEPADAGRAVLSLPPQVDGDQGSPAGLTPQRVRDDRCRLRPAGSGITGPGCRCRGAGEICAHRQGEQRAVRRPRRVPAPPVGRRLRGRTGRTRGRLPVLRVRPAPSAHNPPKPCPCTLRPLAGRTASRCAALTSRGDGHRRCAAFLYVFATRLPARAAHRMPVPTCPAGLVQAAASSWSVGSVTRRPGPSRHRRPRAGGRRRR